MGAKIYTEQNVYDAAIARLNWLFDRFDRICVSFSGGKDSTVLLHLALMIARQRGRTIDVLFIDWEAQYQATINHVAEMVTLSGVGRVYWVCLPISTSNETSMIEPMWTAWESGKEEIWVRSYPDSPHAITDYGFFPFYQYGMTFEEFVPAFADWYSTDTPSAFLIGIRSDESLHRARAILKTKGRKHYEEQKWSTLVTERSWNFYPIYDWGVEDIWAYLGKTGAPYNKIYDLMHLHGLTVHQMRICEPYSKEARKQLDTYRYLEPETWARVVNRVEGANLGARWGGGEMFAFQKLTKPAHLTWKEYAQQILASLPPDTRAHYQRRIDVFIGWFKKHLEWDDLKEESDPKLEAKKLGGSWRMVCRTLVQNDYFCTHLSFSINKREFEKRQQLIEKYKDL